MNKVIVLFSTDFKIEEMVEKGFWERQWYALRKYSQEFKVDVYSSDPKSYKEKMPPSVSHIVTRYYSELFGLRHFLFYIFLIKEAFKWRKEESAVVRAYGVANPVLPIIRAISGKRIVTSFEYDWGKHTAMSYRGIKSVVSRPVQYIALKSSDYVICTMDWLLAIARGKYSKRNVAVIPNFVDLRLFKPRETKKKQLIYVGRLHWSKGVDVLIKAFIEFAKIHPDYCLLIVGDGEERTSLEKLSSGDKKIVFCGSLRYFDVARYLAESEIFVLPTKTMEGHPRALVEAMASGCKCIVSDVPGNKDVMIESKTSELMFKSRDPQDLVEKIFFAVHYSSNNQYEYAVKNYEADALIEKEIVILQNNIC